MLSNETRGPIKGPIHIHILVHKSCRQECFEEKTEYTIFNFFFKVAECKIFFRFQKDSGNINLIGSHYKQKCCR